MLVFKTLLLCKCSIERWCHVSNTQPFSRRMVATAVLGWKVNKRRTPPGAVFAGVEALAGERVGNQRLAVETHADAVRGLARGYIYRASGVPAAVGGYLAHDQAVLHALLISVMVFRQRRSNIRDQKLRAVRIAWTIRAKLRGHGSNDDSAVALEVCSKSATCRRTASKCSGNVLPRRSARRRIPAQAFALKQYRNWWPPVSKISDNEHTLPSLWDGKRV